MNSKLVQSSPAQSFSVCKTINKRPLMSSVNGTQIHRFEYPYHYKPTEYVGIIFVTLFSISTLLHLVQSLFYRMWWLLPTACLCGVLEILGWASRLWSSISPKLNGPFTIQITATIIAPTPLVAANFVILGRIIQELGPAYSRLSPKWYTILFCTCDVISLVIQGVGGGMASTAAATNRDPTPGGNVMLGGIVFQLFTISVYAICAAEFYTRYYTNSPVRKLENQGEREFKPRNRSPMVTRIKLMSFALVFSTTCLFIRAVYRTIELADGWTGRIIGTQKYFNILDGAMVILAIYTLNVAHPGVLLNAKRNEKAQVVLEPQHYVGESHNAHNAEKSSLKGREENGVSTASASMNDN